MAWNWFKTQRIHWIIESIEIYGYCNRHHVQTKFGVSVPQASQDLGDAALIDKRIFYNMSTKRYEHFKDPKK